MQPGQLFEGSLLGLGSEQRCAASSPGNSTAQHLSRFRKLMQKLAVAKRAASAATAADQQKRHGQGTPSRARAPQAGPGHPKQGLGNPSRARATPAGPGHSKQGQGNPGRARAPQAAGPGHPKQQDRQRLSTAQTATCPRGLLPGTAERQWVFTNIYINSFTRKQLYS